MPDKLPAIGEGATQTFYRPGDRQGHEPTIFFPGHEPDANLANLILRRCLADSAVVQESMDAAGGNGGAAALAAALVDRQVLTRGQADELMEIVQSEESNLLGGYKIIDRIGEGGMGTVYMAVQTALDRIVALKVLPERLASDPEFIQRFMREAKVAARIQHSNVVRAIDVGESNGRYYFAMEMVEGQSLEQILRDKKRLTDDEALGIITQATQGLEAAWRDGLVHRDIKPDNILITYDGVVKIADLGLARDAAPAATQLTQKGLMLGTPHYISPEQGTTGDVDTRTDIFAMGVTLFRMVTGEFPWDGNNALVILTAPLEKKPKRVRKLNSAVSKDLERIINVMIDKDRDKRYPDPLVLLHDLRQLAEGEKPKFACGGAAARTQAISAAHETRASGSLPVTASISRRRAGQPGPVRFLLAGLIVSFMMMGAGYLIRDRLVPAFVKEARDVPAGDRPRAMSVRDRLVHSAMLHALRGEFDQASKCCEEVKAAPGTVSAAETRAIDEVIEAIAEARAAAQREEAANPSEAPQPATEDGGVED